MYSPVFGISSIHLSRQSFTLVVFFLLLYVVFRKLRYSFLSNLELKTISVNCGNVPVQRLLAYDTVKLKKNSLYSTASTTQDRKYETPWDLIYANKIYPSSLDSSVYIDEFGYGLTDDLESILRIASNLRRNRKIGWGKLHSSDHHETMIGGIYRRLDRVGGLQYVITFSENVNGKRRRKSKFMVQQRLGSSQCQIHSDVDEVGQDKIYMIVAYHNRSDRLERVLNQFSNLKKNGNRNVMLIITAKRGSEDVDIFQKLKEKIFLDRFSEGARTLQLVESPPDDSGEFSKSLAIREAAKTVEDPDAVIFLCDVDMDVQSDFYERCAQNSIRGMQVFFPIIYSLYSHANSKPKVGAQRGYWNFPGYGMMCARSGDFNSMDFYADGGSRFHGWGPEDKYLYDQFQKNSSLVVFRAVEPSLIHRWHWRICSKNATSYKSCMGSNYIEMGHQLRMGEAFEKLRPGKGL